MSQFGELFSRILSAGGSRGLSRDADRVLAPQPALSFFNAALRRHRATGDLVADPGLLWSTGAGPGRWEGLQAHLLADRGSGVLGFSDVLLVVNRDDWRRSFREVRVPWIERAADVLGTRFASFRQDEQMRLAFPHRPLGFRIIEDGSAEMAGERFGLGPGEFVTGLLPNLYGGPARASRRSIALHLHVPGGWEGYREVGALHSDQVLFTLGSHWLDNFSHPALEVPALYRLHRCDDGSFVHVMNPEVKDRYRIAEHAGAAGPEVLRIERADGTVVAWMVLQVVDEQGPPGVVPPRRWDSTMDELGAAISGLGGSGPVPGPAIMSGRTMVPETIDDRLVSLRETGALLQKVHFARFMEGYDVYLDGDGRVVTQTQRPAATLHVRGPEVSMEAHQDGVRLNGAALPAGTAVFLETDARIQVGETAIEWRDLSGVDVRGWPYLGELRRVGSTSHLVHGRSHRIGREPRCAVRLPDEPHNDNIIWRRELREGGTIRSRNGEIPKSRFYIDSIMVASEHAEVDLGDAPRLRSLARDCYSFIRRGDVVLPLHPCRKQTGPLERSLEPGDEILVGNCVFQISWGEQRPAEVAARLTASELADAMDVTAAAPDAGPGAASDDGLAAAAPSDLPVAAGLGEHGSAPPPQPYRSSVASMLGISNDTFSAVDAPTTPGGARGGLGLPGTPSMPGGGDGILDAPTRPSALRSDILDGPTRPDARPPAMTGVDHTALPFGQAPPPVSITIGGDSLLGDREAPLPGAAAPVKPAPEPSASEMTTVVVVEEATWQHEVSRPARLARAGWVVAGTVVVGNHAAADVIIPESCSAPGQAFQPTDYLELHVQGHRGSFRILSASEASASLGDAGSAGGDDIEGLAVSVLRRDRDGATGFSVSLSLVAEPALPDPRARCLQLDRSDRMTAALFTLGLPLREARLVQIGPITAQAFWDGEQLTVEDYLHTYRRPDGSWRPFFVRNGSSAFRTVPEDGAPLTLRPGDQLIAGRSIHVLEV